MRCNLVLKTIPINQFFSNCDDKSNKNFFFGIFHSPLHTSPVKLRYLQRRRAIRLLPLPGRPTVATRSGAYCLKTGLFFMFASAPGKPTHFHFKTHKTKEFYRNNGNRDLFINIPDKKATVLDFIKEFSVRAYYSRILNLDECDIFFTWSGSDDEAL